MLVENHTLLFLPIHPDPGSSESSLPSVEAGEDDECAPTKSGSDSPESVVSEGEDNTSCSSLEGSGCIIISKTSVQVKPFLMLLAALLTIK
ncbi:hypothetical protein ABG768_021637 [Culter alburnus]|uniref:Uncharacterized protein n=1 Tax=Culter alburnus TaxID=194366 RepID=A0AAW2AUN4_CULAL